ncbi:MAG: hypothetical protein L0Z46_07885 [Nitrospiraceae bacterium]|nr:hypothetical protein [Nitrospiraceae bacterium]
MKKVLGIPITTYVVINAFRVPIRALMVPCAGAPRLLKASPQGESFHFPLEGQQEGIPCEDRA